MKVLVIGAGGREHALVWALKKSPRVTEIVCAPGNGGIAALARCVPVHQKDINDLMRVVSEVAPDLTIVGPELPLSVGLVDEMQRRGLKVFGPTQAAAMLETSKSFAKRFMQRHNIPTANYAVCTTKEEALESLPLFHLPVVVKADGLASGKGVLICETKAEAEQAIAGLFSGKLLGSVETQVVIEEFLTGEELSFLLLSDGKHVAALVPAQDHKRIGEGDTGLNTGGMGVYSTDAMIEPEMREWIVNHIAQPTVNGMAAEDTPFVGVLYVGLMMTARGPMVLEYNTRFGDPETQAILVRLDSDLLEAIEACVEGRLSETEFRWKPGASACVIAASGGYPGSFLTGLPISGLAEAEQVPGVTVFHAGTSLVDGQIVTNGGRVLAVTAAGATLEAALKTAYEGIANISFEGMYYRRDIGHRALKK
ncbi:phosphoribosylamine--glycine ligase [Silvibacterium dinghuense]|uniref:Phosphoribosylamine--glycine ligase n=1 Tax=Silvibacterium dinghuense TaxID=1560006 RepID=A0A4Q1SK26_9BACT|nr:phosphoribosylamine--glycine ligase [Silvibacterium dinghuense]RXS97640.1 phosphoribosylamine--glycine ligase [Silvibacterium dinghuense]GGH00751.1 phosphoribosylamine--glycine ligase [Silvibacterium dinghuense]